MKIILNKVEPEEAIPLEEFADTHGLSMVVTERRNPSPAVPRFYAAFEDAHTFVGVMYTGTTGNGETVREAISNYAAAISGKMLSIGKFGTAVRELRVPNLTYEPEQ